MRTIRWQIKGKINVWKCMLSIVLRDRRFWNSIQYCLNCVTPLVNVLRLVDGDSKLAMPYIYEAMDRAKEKIANNFDNEEEGRLLIHVGTYNFRDLSIWQLTFSILSKLHQRFNYLNLILFDSLSKLCIWLCLLTC